MRRRMYDECKSRLVTFSHRAYVSGTSILSSLGSDHLGAEQFAQPAGEDVRFGGAARFRDGLPIGIGQRAEIVDRGATLQLEGEEECPDAKRVDDRDVHELLGKAEPRDIV